MCITLDSLNFLPIPLIEGVKSNYPLFFRLSEYILESFWLVKAKTLRFGLVYHTCSYCINCPCKYKKTLVVSRKSVT